MIKEHTKEIREVINAWSRLGQVTKNSDWWGHCNGALTAISELMSILGEHDLEVLANGEHAKVLASHERVLLSEKSV